MINKEVLINEICGECAVESKQQAEDILDLIIRTITINVTGGVDVKINRLGIFTTKQMKARIAHNPKTGVPVAIPSHRKIKFKPSQSFIDLVAGKRD